MTAKQSAACSTFHALGNGTRNRTPEKRNVPWNTGGTPSLKALAQKALQRNGRLNAGGTEPETGGTRAEHASVPAEQHGTLPSRTWEPDIVPIIAWFLSSTPPSKPFSLSEAVTVIHPARFWEVTRQDIALGPGRGRAMYGSLQRDLGRLAELFGGPAPPGRRSVPTDPKDRLCEHVPGCG